MTPSNPPERTLQYRYAFYFPDGTLKAFIVTLLHDTLAIVAPERSEHQAWTALDHKQCHNCHLDPALFFDKTFLFYNGSIRREILCVKWIVAAKYWVITYYWMRVVARNERLFDKSAHFVVIYPPQWTFSAALRQTCPSRFKLASPIL